MQDERDPAREMQKYRIKWIKYSMNWRKVFVSKFLAVVITKCYQRMCVWPSVCERVLLFSSRFPCTILCLSVLVNAAVCAQCFGQ